MNLDEFIDDGQVNVAASMFPVSVDVSSTGVSPARFMLLHHPNGEWWTAAWVMSTIGEPSLLLMSKVVETYQIDVSCIRFLSTSGAVTVTPSSGGCCGNRLRSWSPFPPGVVLAHMSMTK